MFSSLLLGVALQIRAMSPAPLPQGAAVAPTPTTSAAVSSDTLTFHARDGGTTVPMSRPIDATIVVDGNLDEARRLTTEVLAAPTFYYAEDYHQQYLGKNPGGYCGLGGTGVSCSIGA